MGSPLEDDLRCEMEAWEGAGLRRRLAETGPREGLVDFASNDYLGLSRHPRLVEAARAALAEHGAGGRASRLLGGRWYDRRGPLQPCLAGLILLALGWLGLWLAGAQGEVLAAACALGLGFGLVLPAIQAMTVDLVPADRRGAANATVFSSFDIGISLGAMGFGLLAGVMDLSGIFLIAGLLTAVATVVFVASVYPHFVKNR